MLVKKSADYSGRPQTYVFNKQSLDMSGVILKDDFSLIPLYGLHRYVGLETQDNSAFIYTDTVSSRCVWIHGLETAQTRFRF